LPEESILSDDFLRELINVGEVDILVGVPTYNDAKTVAQVVQAIRAGLLQYFPRQRAVIINADGGSRDGSQDLVRAASISDLQHVSNLQALRTLHCISTQYQGGPRAGTALHTIFSAADLLRATVCAVVSPDSISIEPDWMNRLLSPVARESFDLVTPTYRRHKFDGMLVRNLVYPMNRAVYSKRVREPYPTEFAFSGRLASYFLGQDIWSQDPGLDGAEMLLTISAIAGNFRLAQSFLGPKSRLDQVPSDLVRAMRHTVGVLFRSLDQNFPVWSSSGDSQSIPTFGAESDLDLEPLRVNRKRLYQMFALGVAELDPVLRSILEPETLDELKTAAQAGEDAFRYSDELWVRTIYEFAGSHHKQVINRDHIIQALAPLYRGKAFTFLADNRDASAEEVESRVEALCRTFERLKPYLLEVWNGRK
jgi:glucosylglycerate synthase